MHDAAVFHARQTRLTWNHPILHPLEQCCRCCLNTDFFIWSIMHF